MSKTAIGAAILVFTFGLEMGSFAIGLMLGGIWEVLSLFTPFVFWGGVVWYLAREGRIRETEAASAGNQPA